MPPNTATKLAQMGDVKANSEKLAKAIEFAKKNPDSPDSIELRRRLERGMFNVELQALNKKPFPVQQPKIDLKKAMAPAVTPAPMSAIPEEKTGILKETGKDVLETFHGVGKQIVEGAKDVAEIAGREDINLAQKFGATAGRTASGMAGILGELTIGAGKMAISQDAENQLKEIATTAGEAISQTETAKKAIDWYENLSTDDKVIVDSAGGIFSLIGSIGGLSVAGKGTKMAVETGVPKVAEGIAKTAEIGKEGTKTAIGLTQKVLTPSAEEATQRINEATQRIVQAKTTRDIDLAKKALSRIDTTDVKTYKDLNTKIDNNISALSQKVDAELEKQTTKFKPEQLGVYSKVGEETVTTTPVQDAINGLEEAYTKSGEAVQLAKIRQLKTKLENEGLTVKELNDLAREYGIEYKDRAFSKLGDPKPGYNAESFENTRKGIKDVVRERMPDDITKKLDEEISANYATKDLTSKLEQEIMKAESKRRKFSLPQQIGRGVYNVVDIISLGTLQGIMSKVALKGGAKYIDKFQLEEELTKNLNTIRKMNEIQDPKAFEKAFEKYLKEDLPIGMSIRSTVQPDKVAKQITNQEFDMMVDGIEDISLARTNPDFNEMLTKYGLTNAQDDELVRFLKDVTDEADIGARSNN